MCIFNDVQTMKLYGLVEIVSMHTQKLFDGCFNSEPAFRPAVFCCAKATRSHSFLMRVGDVDLLAIKSSSLTLCK